MASITSFANASLFYSALSNCPILCDLAGPDPSNWTYYETPYLLSRCKDTVIFDMNIHHSIKDSNTRVITRACSTRVSRDSSDALAEREFGRDSTLPQRGTTNLSIIKPISKPDDTLQEKLAVRFMQWGDTATGVPSADIGTAVNKLGQSLSQDTRTYEYILFAMSGSTVIATYIGSEFDKTSFGGVIQRFREHIEDLSGTTKAAVENCGISGGSAFGIVADFTGDIAFVQRVLANWSNAICLPSTISASLWNTTSVSINKVKRHTEIPEPDSSRPSLSTRATCRYTQVKADDGCWALANRCKINQNDLKKFNPGPKFCETLKLNQYVCCSAGSLPDFSPQPRLDGTCFDYIVKPGDNCADIAVVHSTNVTYVESINGKVWGWAGCTRLQVGQRICLSKGDPPLPASMPNAMCGPQVPGTKRPVKGTDFSHMNPCPLNACCDVWGQCGITPEFCTPAPADTGAPGTARPGTNGCISNCGTSIVNNNQQPRSMRSIGYFEGWNAERKCLHMKPSDIKIGQYTDIHYAFANITEGYDVELGKYDKVFKEFVKLKNVNRVLSFGGWSFSTAWDTFPIFRNAVTDAQRQLFAKNVADFVTLHRLDGVDFDWEYPGAPDIPGIPKGDVGDGDRYLDFLKLVRKALPQGKTLSIAAPASFWYLEGFPIKAIGEVVDYIVYMTYDLHGQWDYEKPFASEGCPHGSCLRSHVNATETLYALAMITKAGVPASKVVVGMAKYGRAFKMSKSGCTGPDCTFRGPKSQAWAGDCTDTAGYLSNFEIRQIIANPDDFGGDVKTWSTKDGDFLVFDNNTQWVSYLSDESYSQRKEWVASQQLGGIVDWAMDLDKDFDINANGSTGNPEPEEPMCNFYLGFDSLNDLEAVSDAFPPYCRVLYSLGALSNELQFALGEYLDIDANYDELFGYYVKYIKNMIPATLRRFMSAEGLGYFDCILQDGVSPNPIQSCSSPLNTPPWSAFNLTYILRDKDGFYKDLQEKYGISPDWVDFGQQDVGGRCPPTSGCAPGQTLYGVPQEAKNITIPNPKDIVKLAGPNMETLSNIIDATWMDAMLSQWGGSVDEVAEILYLPVALVKQAVDSMKQVKEIGETEKEEEQKNLIIIIITAVLAVVPFVGEAAASAAGLANLARIIAIVGELANDAMTIYDIVKDPESAPMAIFGMLLGAAFIPRTPESFEEMGKLRLKMKEAGDLSRLGKVFEDDTGKMNRIWKTCK